MKRFLAPFLLLVFATVGLAAEHTADKPAKVKENLQAGKAQLIDVRELSEWKAGHLKDARLLSLSTLTNSRKPTKKQLDKVLDEKKIIYLHCAAGVRTLKAGEILSKYGYDIRPLKPGYQALLDAGFEKAE